MGPYSHIVIASELESYIKPDHAQEYYWGAVAPDIRYLVTGMLRSQTHISSEKILGYVVQYPELEDFLKGYLVHCLMDQLDCSQIIQHKFPFNLQKNELSAQQCAVILEFFNILRVKPVNKSLSGANNAVLRELGISDHYAAKFSQEINKYITSPSLLSSVALFKNLGFVGNGSIEKYRAVAQQFQSNWLRKNLIMFGLQIGEINREITTSVKSMLPMM
ncbi:MAG: hypothetical protein IMY76_00180 [Chloroflexi bacterium]|nr:hypothetical protein [Chloroflexota bacterium]